VVLAEGVRVVAGNAKGSDVGVCGCAFDATFAKLWGCSFWSCSALSFSFSGKTVMGVVVVFVVVVVVFRALVVVDF